MYCKIFLTKNLSRTFSVVPKEEELDFFRILCKGKISKQIVSSGKFVVHDKDKNTIFNVNVTLKNKIVSQPVCEAFFASYLQ